MSRGNLARRHQRTAQRRTAVEAEWRWLRGDGEEPAWVNFPDNPVLVRERTYVGGAPSARRQAPHVEHPFYADHQAAAVWLSSFTGRDFVAPDWLRAVADHYRDWTSRMNGLGLPTDDELARSPHEWNDAYYRLIARCMSGLDADAIDRLCLTPILSLPDAPFLDVMADFLLPLDAVYFEDKGVGPADVVRIRTKLAERLQQISSWRRFAQKPGYGIPHHLDLALGALFLTEHGFRAPPQCYVTAFGSPRIAPLVPLLTDLAASAPSLFVAMATLSIVTVSPDHPFIEFGVKAIQACMQAFPDDIKLWIDYGIGRKFCAWIAGVIRHDGIASLDTSVRGYVEQILSALIRIGVPEATALETALSAAVSS